MHKARLSLNLNKIIKTYIYFFFHAKKLNKVCLVVPYISFFFFPNFQENLRENTTV